MVAERHDEMADFIQRMGEQPVELFVEGRNMLSVGDKNAVGSRRAAWRVVTSVEQKENIEGIEEQAAFARKFVVEVEAEHQKVCDGILVLTDENLFPSASTGEPKVLQRQAPMIQEVLKTVEFPRVQYVDEIVDVPVVAQSQVPIVRLVQKTVEVPQSQFPDRVVDVPVVNAKTGAARQVPQEQIRVVEETDVPVPRVMDEIIAVVWLEITVLTDHRGDNGSAR